MARANFEDDFDTGPSFWQKQHRPQVRMSSGSSDNVSASKCLYVRTVCGVAGIDTFSDVETALAVVLNNIRPAPACSVQHLGGVTSFSSVGDLSVDPLLPIVTCYVVTEGQLPPGCVAMLGPVAITKLGLSLDRIAFKPGCTVLEATIPSPAWFSDGIAFRSPGRPSAGSPRLVRTNLPTGSLARAETTRCTRTTTTWVVLEAPRPVARAISSPCHCLSLAATLSILVRRLSKRTKFNTCSILDPWPLAGTP
jgi:hypothetical protein